MRIAMFGHKHIPSREGGIEIVVKELSARMAAMGHEVTCYNRGGHHVSGAQFDAAPSDHLGNVRIRKVWTLNRRGLAAVSSSVSAAFCTAFSRADVVHIHAEGPAAMCWLPKLFGKKIIVTVHGLDHQRAKWGRFARWYIQFGERCAVKFADEIIVLSRGTQEYFRNIYGRETVFIPNGVTRPDIRDAERIRAQFGLEKDGYILFLGRLVPEKGIHYLIEAYRNIATDRKLVIAGGCSNSDEYCRKLRSLAEGNENILFTGFVQGRVLEELYSNAYLYVLPSDLEGMPLSLLEAMSYGNCCVTSDIPECAEVVEEHGVTFPHGMTEKLAAKLQQLCDEPETVRGYQKSACDFVCGKYSWNDVTKRTLELYR